eukprot:scaffold19039_cov72-Phaeocystis_antarctica.AAC.2
MLGRGSAALPREKVDACVTSKFVLPQTCVCVLDPRTVAWSGVSMRMCPPQCITCKSVRVDEFDDFVRESERVETV